MYDFDERGEVEKGWAEAVEDLGVPAHLWDEVILRDFTLPPGKKLPDAFLLLMKDWVQNGGERYDYVRPHGMSDQHYINFLLVQAYGDTKDSEADEYEFLWGPQDSIAQQRQKAIDDFNQGNITGPRN